MQLHINNTAEETLEALADFFIAAANLSVSKKGIFVVALSGGSSPKKLHQLLAAPDRSQQLDWTKVYFFFGDERYVPHTSADSNYRMAKETLLDPLKIDAHQVFAIDTSLAPEEAAKHYEDTINRFFNGNSPVFDLIILGLGDNSHTASLFPFTGVLDDVTPAVKAVYLKDQEVYRITLNAPLINLASQIAFLVYGEGKAIAVHHVLEDAANIPEYPAQLISKENAHWFLDKAAAVQLSNKS